MLPSTSELKVICPVCNVTVSSSEIKIHANMCVEKSAASDDYANVIPHVSPTYSPEPKDFEITDDQQTITI